MLSENNARLIMIVHVQILQSQEGQTILDEVIDSLRALQLEWATFEPSTPGPERCSSCELVARRKVAQALGHSQTELCLCFSHSGLLSSASRVNSSLISSTTTENTNGCFFWLLHEF